MENIIYDHSISIHYKIFGQGKPLVLLHGYLESVEVWGEFAQDLAKDFQVICIDLPGHGKTGASGETSSMEFMADCVHSVVNHLNINKLFLIGHSMGGYVALAYLEKYKESLEGICLLHSHPFADSEATVEKRKREIEIVQSGKKELIYNVNIPNAFANDNHEKFSDQIQQCIRIAAKTSDEGIIAALNGMMIRPDRSNLLVNIEIPFIYVFGMKDNYIPQSVFERIPASKNRKNIILEEAGHNGFIECKNLIVNSLSNSIKV